MRRFAGRKVNRRTLFVFCVGVISCFVFLNILPLLTNSPVYFNVGNSSGNHVLAREYLFNQTTALRLSTTQTTTARAIHPVNPHPFNYIINNASLCKTKKPLKYLIYVHSAPSNFAKRQNMRETWASINIFRNFSSRVVFLLASVADNDLQLKVYQESLTHHDIVQEDFIDSYKNLTYKAIMGLKWTSTYCSNAHYVIKSDDDTFLNIFEWVDVLDSVAKPRSISGLVWTTMPILRDPKTCMKWCVQESELKGRFFPKYCAGLSFTLTSDIVGELYSASLSTPFFWVDDVYVTGLLPKKLLSITYTNLHKHYELSSSKALKLYREHGTPLKIFVTMAGYTTPHLWKETLKRLNANQRKQLSDEFNLKYSNLLLKNDTVAVSS